jgi:membrane-associated protease RseP (regulator of RpoE activity)
MDIELIIAICFFVFVSIFVFINRKKMTIEKILFPIIYFPMYKTKLGLKGMDFFAKHFVLIMRINAAILSLLIAAWIWLDKTLFSSWIKIVVLAIGIFIIYVILADPIYGIQRIITVVGFSGMGLISYELVKNIIQIFTNPQVAAKSVGLVLPFQVKGAFYVPFTWWIISIFILAVVHEFSHGVIARVNKIKIKSSGFAFLAILVPIIPAAFVEPDEKQLKKKKKLEQFGVFGAGPLSNIILGFVVLGLFSYGIVPVLNETVIGDGVFVTDIKGDELPAYKAGMKAGEAIMAVDNIETLNIENFTNYMKDKKPGDTVKITTNVSDYKLTLVENPDDPKLGYMGIGIAQNIKKNQAFIDKHGQFYTDALTWFAGLIYWLFVLNLGIGLFNLVPLGPVDGGRMLRLGLQNYLPEKRADRIWTIVSIVFLVMILINISAGFLI